MQGRVLIIAGSDSGGGAGIQADIKTVTAMGGYAATAVTAVTVQDTKGVYAVHEVPPHIIREQIKVVLGDIGADAIKIGMVGSTAAAQAILEALDREGLPPIVLDPVLVATSGDSLGGSDVANLLRDVFVPQSAVVTPNLPELAALTGLPTDEFSAIQRAAEMLLTKGAKAVLAKGGHGESDTITDLLLTPSGQQGFSHPRLETSNTHGTGCTLASAIATGLAQGLALDAATERAIAATVRAIQAAPGFGSGHGPLGHGAMAD